MTRWHSSPGILKDLCYLILLYQLVVRIDNRLIHDMRANYRKVPSACERCRKQKLKVNILCFSPYTNDYR